MPSIVFAQLKLKHSSYVIIYTNESLCKTFKNCLNTALHLFKHPVSQFSTNGDDEHEDEMSKSVAFNRPHEV